MGVAGHQNFEYAQGNDGGYPHLSCMDLFECRIHDCNPNFTLAPGELNVVVDMLATLPAKEIAALHEAEPNLTLNRGRSAVQVLGCQGTVLASVALGPSRVRALEALGDW